MEIHLFDRYDSEEKKESNLEPPRGSGSPRESEIATRESRIVQFGELAKS
jgi:hypothetical protein